MYLFMSRSKRRKHGADVDTVTKCLSELSHIVTFSDGSCEKNVEMLKDFVVKLDEMLTASDGHDTQVFDNVSVLSHMLQVGSSVCLTCYRLVPLSASLISLSF